MSEINQISGYYDWQKGLCLPADEQPSPAAPKPQSGILSSLVLAPLSLFGCGPTGPKNEPQPASSPAPASAPATQPASAPTAPMTQCEKEGCKLAVQRGRLLQGHFATDEPDHDTMQEFNTTFGKKIDIELRYINFDSGMHFPLQAAKTAAANGATLFIKIEPFAGKRRPNDEFDYLGEINKGTFDELFVSIGKEIREFGGPVVLTFGHEMNIEYEGNGTYPWAGPHAAGKGKFVKAYSRVHDLISTNKKVKSPERGIELEGGGANNVTWVLNFDYRDYENLDQYIPPSEYFDIVAIDGYVNDQFLPRNRGNAKQVMHNIFDNIFKTIEKNPKCKGKDLMIGEFGVNSKGKGMNEKRKAELVGAFLDYQKEFNADSRHPNPIVGYVYFDVNKDPKNNPGGDYGTWKLTSIEAQKAYRDWIKNNSAIFSEPLQLKQLGSQSLVEFNGPQIPVAEAFIDLSNTPARQGAPADPSWNTLVAKPEGSAIGEYNRKIGLPLLDRWKLELYTKAEKEKGEKLLASGIDAFLQVNPDVPLNYSVSFMDEYQEIARLQQNDRKLPWDIALASYFYDPEAYWENAVTFVSVYAQKGVEKQDETMIQNAARACELLIKRFETQSGLEVKTQLPEKNYAYPSIHNLALLKLILADARSQLKYLDEADYRNAIEQTVEAISLLRKLEKGVDKILHPTGADYFSISKGLITIGDLNVRLAQIHTRKLEFTKADTYFRAAQDFYTAVANLDVGGNVGITVNAEALPGMKIQLDNITVDMMLKSWEYNLSKGYIRYSDKLRGFQGTFHFLKALAAIKIQGAFLENSVKGPKDYEMASLFNRLVLLENSFDELKFDKDQDTRFLRGLAYIIKANLLTMIGDRAQYDTSNMDRASARVYFNGLTKRLGETVAGFDESITGLRQAIEKAEKSILKKPTYFRSRKIKTIDDNLLIEKPMAPFKKTAGNSKRFALIIAYMVEALANQAYGLSGPEPKKESNGPRFPYIFMLANLLQVDMAVRKFYITADPFENGKELLDKIKTARLMMKGKEDKEDWFRFQARFLEASLLILRNIDEGADLDQGVEILETARKQDIPKFIDQSQIFYTTQIYLLQGLAHVQRKKPGSYENARAIVAKLEGFMKVKDPTRDKRSEIEKVSDSIGWNLKDFKVRYSKLKIRSANMKVVGFPPIDW